MSSAPAKCGPFHVWGTTSPRAAAGLPSEWAGWNQRHKVRQLKAEEAASCSRDCDPDMYHTPEKRTELHFLPLLILSGQLLLSILTAEGWVDPKKTYQTLQLHFQSVRTQRKEISLQVFSIRHEVCTWDKCTHISHRSTFVCFGSPGNVSVKRNP